MEVNMKNILLIMTFAFLTASCKNKEEKTIADKNNTQKEIVSILENNNTAEGIIFVSENDIILNNNYKPTHMVYKTAGISGGLITIYATDDVNSKKVGYIDLGETIQVIDIGGNIIINDENANWYKIRNQKHGIGWCTSNYFIDITEIDLSQLAMNKIDIHELVIPNKSGEDNIIRISGRDGYFTYNYGINKVFVGFYNRTEEFDSDFMYDNMYYPNLYSLMDVNIYNDIEEFPIIYFNRNRRKNHKNGILFVDSFGFAAHDVSDKGLTRYIFFSTNNYNIKVSIFIPYEQRQDIYNKILSEVPGYFKVRIGDREYNYNNSNGNEGEIIWDYRNDTIEKFGEDLIKQKNGSITAIEWYQETEEILNRLFIR
jgi:hypothetical protein